jgi:hypothetical protein
MTETMQGAYRQPADTMIRSADGIFGTLAAYREV